MEGHFCCQYLNYWPRCASNQLICTKCSPGLFPLNPQTKSHFLPNLSLRPFCLFCIIVGSVWWIEQIEIKANTFRHSLLVLHLFAHAISGVRCYCQDWKQRAWGTFIWDAMERIFTPVSKHVTALVSLSTPDILEKTLTAHRSSVEWCIKLLLIQTEHPPLLQLQVKSI